MRVLLLGVFICFFSAHTKGQRAFILKKDSTQIVSSLLPSSVQESVLVRVSKTKEFAAWIKDNRAQWIVKKEGDNLFRIYGLKQELVKEFSEVPFIEFIDRANRKATVETVLGEFDQTVNAVTAVHAAFPDVNGSTTILSVKEKPFNQNDIDLLGRVLLNTQFDEPSTQHATFMASIAAGAGNSTVYARGSAWASHITTSDFDRLLPDAIQNLIEQGVTVQNHSYGVGLENYYGIESSAYDQQVFENPTMVHVFSSGNEGNKTPEDGTYKDVENFANLTGQFKVSKNTISVGSSDRYGNIVSLSSRGPAHDGRVKPELIASGDAGSSEAAAVVSGIAMLVQDAFKKKYDQLPDAALVKAALINGAQDSGRPHVDFETGFGNVQALQAVRAIDQQHFFSETISHGEEKSFTIQVPTQVDELKITLVWTDPPASPLPAKALVNDLDVTLTNTTTNETWNPWILDTTPQLNALQSEAIRGVDRLNNVEQITIATPTAGEYQIKVNGFSVSTIPQKFFLVFDYLSGVEWTYPAQGNAIPARHENILRWSWQGGDQLATLEFRMLPDNDWMLIDESVNLKQHYFQWQTPDISGPAQLRLTAPGVNIVSSVFAVSTPERVKVGFNCEEDVMLQWSNVPNADSYQIYTVGEKYLQLLLTVSDTVAIVNKNQITTNYFSVVPLFIDLPGAREASIDYNQQGVSCYVISFSPQDYLVNQSALFDLRLGTTYQVNSVSLERLENGSYKTIQTVTPVTNNAITLADANPIKGYNYYRARINHQLKQPIYSNESEIVLATASDLFVYPNPVISGNNLNIVIDNEEDALIRIVDVHGNIIRGVRDFGTERNIDTSNLLAGVYFIKVFKSNGTTLVTRVVIK